MRFVVITRLLSPVPPEQLPALMEHFAHWREQYSGHLEAFEFFAGGGGGFMVINTPDEITLNQIMAEYPLVNYLDIEVRPIIDGDTGLAQWWQVMRRMLGDSDPPEGSAGSEEASPVSRQNSEKISPQVGPGRSTLEPPPEGPIEPPPPGPPPDANALA